ncbi:hypothetical protein SAY87_017288 [Trapa incisa]|uniref:DUF4005 domain-containing protein n=1 Tax=Trapa incisa TaxID=236973 RepID=A0AAN7L7G8_9MYRT|nr:hypothetical protein SAY87_017288 [Trapa incisa]
MGRAVRWLKGFLGMKKDRENVVDNASPASGHRREKRRWSFSKPGKEPNGHPPFSNALPSFLARKSGKGDTPWLGSYAVEAEEDWNQSRHIKAIAMAAGTTITADIAVAAAQTAVAVAGLTGASRWGRELFGYGKEVLAAMKIQSAFRGFLARKALKALRGIVKLQAMVRGYLVRKRAATILQQMQSLLRAQSMVRSQKARRSLDKENHYPERSSEWRSEFHSKRFPRSIDIPVDDSPKVIEVDSIKARSRSGRISNSPLSERDNLGWCECRFIHTCHTAHGFPIPIRIQEPTVTAAPVVRRRSACMAAAGLFHQRCTSVASYMENTKSSRAKVRAQSTPRQRPEKGAEKWLSVAGNTASRHSISGVRNERSCNHLAEILE